MKHWHWSDANRKWEPRMAVCVVAADGIHWEHRCTSAAGYCRFTKRNRPRKPPPHVVEWRAA